MSTSRFVLKVNLNGEPVSTNHVYKHGRGRVYMTEEGKELKEAYQWDIKAQFRGEPLKGKIRVEVHLFFKDQRRRDWDNWHKLSMDAMNGIVWEDDSQICEAQVVKHTGYAFPHIEIHVFELL